MFQTLEYLGVQSKSFYCDQYHNFPPGRIDRLCAQYLQVQLHYQTCDDLEKELEMLEIL